MLLMKNRIIACELDSYVIIISVKPISGALDYDN